MQALKYSRQREAIKEFLNGRTDHPTADMVYMNIRKEFPNISLGTVYRNLALLSDIGEILKLSTGAGGDRFDANTSPHYHFICSQCHDVIDLKMPSIDKIDKIAGENFNGEVEGHTVYFYGRCEKCKSKQEPV